MNYGQNVMEHSLGLKIWERIWGSKRSETTHGEINDNHGLQNFEYCHGLFTSLDISIWQLTNIALRAKNLSFDRLS